MAEKTILVGVIPEAMVIGPSDQVAWVAGEGQLKIEFDANRSPFRLEYLSSPVGRALAQLALRVRAQSRDRSAIACGSTISASVTVRSSCGKK